jgi:hypothetical protein
MFSFDTDHCCSPLLSCWSPPPSAAGTEHSHAIFLLSELGHAAVGVLHHRFPTVHLPRHRFHHHLNFSSPSRTGQRPAKHRLKPLSRRCQSIERRLPREPSPPALSLPHAGETLAPHARVVAIKRRLGRATECAPLVGTGRHAMPTRSWAACSAGLVWPWAACSMLAGRARSCAQAGGRDSALGPVVSYFPD